jgi:hypothetical protein
MSDGRKYGKFTDLFLEIQPEKTEPNEWQAQPYGYFKGEEDIPNSQYRMGFQVIKAPVVYEKETHFHREEQYYIFLDHKLPDTFGFDAEIEFFMGEDPDNLEKIVVTKPTVIRVPANMWHGPVNFKRVGRPVFLEDPMFAGRAGSIKRRFDADGKPYLIFDGGAN